MEYSSACQKPLNESHGCVCYWTETIMLSDAFIQRVNEYPERFFFSPVTIWTLFFSSGLQGLYQGTGTRSIPATNVGAR